jgi:hypothetical protein
VSPINDRPEIFLAPDSVELLAEIFRQDLCLRRAFVPGASALREREVCDLCILHPNGSRFVVAAEPVYVKSSEPGAGVGLHLVGLDSARLKELEGFVASEAVALASPGPSGEMETPVSPGIAGESTASEADASAAKEVDTRVDSSLARNVFERVRKLSLRERERVARQGQLSERMALERVYGSSVWDALLQNPMLTVPEVAQIARKGALPQPLVASIVANNAWLASGEVRRALLSNPRVAGVQLDRVLRAAPKAELKQIASMSPYRSQVRSAAKALLERAS